MFFCRKITPGVLVNFPQFPSKTRAYWSDNFRTNLGLRVSGNGHMDFEVFDDPMNRTDSKKNRKRIKTSNQAILFCKFVFPYFSLLAPRIEHFGPQIRSLPEISSLEPDSHVWNRKSSLKNLKVMFYLFYSIMGLSHFSCVFKT